MRSRCEDRTRIPDRTRNQAQKPMRARAAAAAVALWLAVAALLPPGAPALAAGGGAPGTTAAAAPSSPYVDLDPHRYGWALPAILDLRQRGLMIGVDARHFAPSRPLTRAELAVLFVRLKALPLDGVGPAYSDLPPGAWYFAAAEAAAANGLLLGVTKDRFAPQDPVTRAMTAVVAVRALGLDRVAQDLAGAALPYRDAAAVPAWARGAVSIAGALGVMQGDAAGFRPQQSVTRAEAAVIVERLLAVPDEAVAAQGNRAVAYLNVDVPRAELNVGDRATFRAWGHDAATYLIPTAVAWSASQGTIAPDGTFAAAKPGTARITATVPGTGVARTVTVKVHQPARLAFGDGLPPVALAGTPFTAAVAVLDTAGALDPADNGRTVTLIVSGPSGASRTLTARTSGGWATFTLALDAPGAYTLTAQAGSLETAAAQVQAAAQPVGALELTADGAPAGAAPLPRTAGDTVSLAVAVRAPDGSLRPERFPVRLSVSGAGAALTQGSVLVRGSAAAGQLRLSAPGAVALSLSVPGGAVLGASAAFAVQPRGTVQILGANPAQVAAGRPATLQARLLGPDGTPLPLSGVTVTLTPHGPHGYDLPALAAATQNGVATFTFTPVFAGAYGFQASAPGFAPGDAGGVLNVTPAELAQLVIHAAPSTILAPGGTASIYAALADRYGNAIDAPFQLRAQAAAGSGTLGGTLSGSLSGDAAAGLDAQTALAGPGTVAIFTAGAAGARTLTFTSPDHPQLPPVTVTFRVVQRPADVVAGKGLWLLFGDWKAVDDDEIVRRAVQGGYSHIYLEIATSGDGFYGRRALDQLLWKVHNAGIAFIAWVYPDLRNPASDTAWTRDVIAYATPEGDRPDAFAPDIEEVLDPSTVAAYAAAVRAALGPEGRFVAVTYPPQARPDYPFRQLAPYVDAFAPMSYWHTRVREYTFADAYRYVADSVRRLRQLAGVDVPVSVIGQTYDMFAAGGRGVYSPTPLELEGAWRAVLDTGAIGLSFYRWGTTTDEQWAAIDALQPPPAGAAGAAGLARR
ncbi:MAG: S-layer homology domain-containing protein [Firmicutes bacterium]|nr:S-layer homology domain-containing protein [Bacillota bacterium]